MTKIAFIMIHYGQVTTTSRALTQLSAKIGNHSLILINNTVEDISSLTKIIKNTKMIDNQVNTGFAKAVNQGITLALADKNVTHVMLINNDLSLANGTVDELLRTYLKYPRAGIVSPVLHHSLGYDWGGKYNKWTGMVAHTNWPNKPKTVLSVDHVAGAAMLISRELIDKIGMLDERFFLYYEDLDFCLRTTKTGYTIHINPAVVAEHATSSGSSVTGRTMYQWRSHLAFLLKYMPVAAYPTALVWDTIFYPLVILKSLIIRNS